MKKPVSNVGASVRARLLRLARERGEDFQLVLVRYANERLLYRLSKSRHASRFVLKGATLFGVWTGAPHRATRDIDLLGSGNASESHIREVFAEVIALDVEDDGLELDVDSMNVGPIRDGQEYAGLRVVLNARLTSAQLRLQIDIGFGDVITPAAVTLEVPTLLDQPAPRLRVYPKETVIAEKLEALVQLGIANSRMKDFYDLAVLAESFEFEGESLVAAIRATFARRGTALPVGLPWLEKNEVGPIVSLRQFERVMGYIESGRREGAELLTGGGPPRDPELRGGFFVSPTVFDRVTPAMKIGREEIFGPVMSIMPWADFEEMLARVNGVEYGLTAAIVTNDLAKAMETADRVEAGYIWINSNGRYLGAPYGGWKQSGLGQEECFDELLSYTQIKNVNMRW